MSLMLEICDRWKVRPKGIIHLGAHQGQELPIYASWQVPKVAWVEANPALIPILEKNVGIFPGHTVHETAIWETDGRKMEFYLASNEGSSSLLPMKLHSKRYPEVTLAGVVEVRTSSVDGLIKSAKLVPEDYDFLNMDVQGIEGLVIEGMKKQIEQLRWIYTEVNFEELYEGCWLFPDLYRVLKNRGFELAECRRAGLGWGEALFFRP